MADFSRAAVRYTDRPLGVLADNTTLFIEVSKNDRQFNPASFRVRGRRRYQVRFAGGGLRMRRIGIVAPVARKLLIALWRTLEDGVMPEGARLIASEI